MSNGYSALNQYDAWLADDGDFAALTLRQHLVPVEGRDAVFFPPTYPVDTNKAGYNVDRFDDGSSVCQVDSVGSQANRIEPIFKRSRYQHLVPQVVIQASGRAIHLLDAGHRAADAVVRFSTLGPELHEAFRAYREDGNAVPLARIAPTSIVFGAWDSRATQVKLPRIVRSVIRAYSIRVLTRSAQYSTIAGEILGGGDAEVTTEGPKAELGLAHVPAVKTHGGVQLETDRGMIRREAVVKLAALRCVGGSSTEETLALRRYVLGLALVGLTAPLETNLREGCELVGDPDRPPSWTLVRQDGTRTEFSLSHEEALSFATAAAGAFATAASVTATFIGSPPPPPPPAEFSAEIANRVLGLSKDERKRVLRQGPVTLEALERLASKTAGDPAAELKKKKVGELRSECEQRGLSTDGKKADLIKRLLESASTGEDTAEDDGDVEDPADAS